MENLFVFSITGQILIDKTNGVKFQIPLEYSSSKNVTVKVLNDEEDAGILYVQFTIEGNDLGQAVFLAESELLQIANVLSWEHNIAIKEFKIISKSYSYDNDDNTAICVEETLNMVDSVSISLIIGEVGLHNLSSKFTTTYDQDFDNLMLMWREAISEESKGLQFLLYFRIIEHLQGGKRKNVDRYLRVKDPSAPLEKDKNGIDDISIYTYLRDNVHAKNPHFPFKKIEQFLPKLSTYTKEAVLERFPCI